MHFDFLVVGQGICGTLLHWYLKKAGYSCCIIDRKDPGTASQVAAGIINPVTGRRMVKTWKIETLLPAAWSAYTALGEELGINAISEKNVLDLFPTPQMRVAFEKRLQEDGEYLSMPSDVERWSSWFHFEFGAGEISPCYLVNLPEILSSYRLTLPGAELIEEWFDHEQPTVGKDSVSYKGITSSHIVYCDGVGATQNPFFNILPFAPNKGEVLWINARGLPESYIFKQGMQVVPWKPPVFWVGSSYEWDYRDDNPTEVFRDRTVALLKRLLKTNFEVLDHRASVRPATIERRPFVGFHPVFPQVGILNGMGTKGCSLAPFFARQLVEHVQNHSLIDPEADVARFRLLLKKNL